MGISRTLQRLAVVLVAPAVLGLATPANAVTIVCPTTEAALASLITATPTGNTIAFTCATDTTIAFDAAHGGTGAPITITKNVILNASGAAGKVIFDGGDAVELFVVNGNAGQSLTLNTLTLQHGYAQFDPGAVNAIGPLTVLNCTFDRNAGRGAIQSQWGAALTVSNSTFSNNKGGYGSAIGTGGAAGVRTITNSTFSNNAAGTGGGSYEGAYYTNAGTTTITGSAFTSNYAEYGGGAIESQATTTVNVTDTTFTGNTASLGAAIQNGGNLTLTRTTFSANTSPYQGGAIENAYGGTLTITDSTFTGNTAVMAGGAIYNHGSSAYTTTANISRSTFTGNRVTNASNAYGGAIYNNSGSTTRLNVGNSTFSGNSSVTYGAAIFNYYDNAATVLTNDTFAGNTTTFAGYGSALSNYSGTVSLTGNVLTGASPRCYTLVGGVTTDVGYNVEAPATTTSTCSLSVALRHDVLTSNVQLGALASNGGPTQTVALLATSPAIGTIPTSTGFCPATDQRGSARPDAGMTSCDMGAYEFQAATTTVLGSSVNPSVYGQAVTFTATVSSAEVAKPTGAVQFQVDGTNAGSPVALLANGTAPSAPISTLTASGSPHSVTASYTPGAGSKFSASVATALSQTVTKAPSTVTASHADIAYGDAAPTSFTVNYSAGAPAGMPACATSYVQGNHPGGYPITCTLGTLADGNYTFVNASATPLPADGNPGVQVGTLTVDKAAVHVSASHDNIVVGDPAPTSFTIDYDGGVVPAGAPDCATTYVVGDADGPYPIRCTIGTLASNDYAFVSPVDVALPANGVTGVALGMLTVEPQKTTTTSSVGATATYGGSATLTAVVDAVEGGLNGVTVTFSFWNGTGWDPVCGGDDQVACPTTAAYGGLDGVARLTGVTLPGAYGHAGSYVGVVKAAYAGDASHTGSDGTGDLTVGTAHLDVTANVQSSTYGGPLPEFDATVTGLVNGDTFAGLGGTCDAPVTTATPVGDYDITCTGVDPSDYDVSYTKATLTIGQASLTVAANPQSMPYGGPLPEFDATVTGLTAEDTFESLGGTCGTTADTASPVGDYDITCSGVDDTNYDVDYTKATLTIGQAPLDVAANPQSMTYGGTVPEFDATVTGLVPGDTFAALGGTCDALVTSATAAGDYDITCSGVDETNYDVSYTPSTLTIDRAPLDVAANPNGMGYGDPVPDLDATVTGLVGTDTFASLGGTCDTTATSSSPAGDYPITCSGVDDTNYDVSYTPSTLKIDRATLHVVAKAKSMTYGGTVPAFDATVTGLVGSDTFASLGGSCDADVTSATPAGDYPITCSGVDDTSYDVSYTPSTLKIDRAPLGVVAKHKTMTYGGTVPVFDATVTGLVGTDTFASLGGTCAAAVTSATPADDYQITCDGVDDTNYDVSYTPSTITIGRAPLGVAAKPKTMTYGGTVPAFDATVTGLVAGDTFVSLGGTCGASVTSATPVGSYPITCSGVDPANYDVSYTPSSIGIGPAPLTVTAENKTVQYGDPLPALTVAYQGFVLNQGGGALGGTLSCTTTATVSGGKVVSPAGLYAINCSGQTSTNYTIGYHPGTLTVSGENVVVRLAQNNPHAVQVDTAGTNKGKAPAMTFSARITEAADGSYGDITKATPVTFTLSPVGSGSSITCAGAVTQLQPSTATSPGFVVVGCTVPKGTGIDVYDVHVAVGGTYYTGSDDSVLTVYDPLAGGSNAAGTMGALGDVSFSASYLKNGQVQGKFLYIQRDTAGNAIHVLKGNAMSTMAISGTTASITGKATLDGAGNYTYVATGTDNGNPNPVTNPDRYGQKITDPAGIVVGPLTFAPAAIGNGNVFVGK